MKPPFRRKPRLGSITFEVILIIPILVIASFAVFQFGVAMIVKQAVAHAATVGAREAGKGADMDEIEYSVEQVLAVLDMTVGADLSIVLEDPTGAPMIDQRGALPCTPPATPALSSDEVRVTVCANMGTKPFINTLSLHGIDFTGRTMTMSSVVKKEEL